MLLGDIPKRNARFYPTRAAVVEGSVRLDFRELNRRINRLANVISGLPCRKGDGVAVLAHNCFRYVELYFACAKAGTPIVPLNYRLSGRELTYILNHSEARALFFGQKYLPLVEEIRGDLECVAHLVCLDGGPAGIPQYEDLLRMASDAEPDVPLSEEDVAILGYTGGTTGLPKGVMTTHKNVISSCYNCAVEMRLHPDTVYLNAPPLFHAGDAMGMFAFSFAGGTNVVVDSFDPERVLRIIEGGAGHPSPPGAGHDSRPAPVSRRKGVRPGQPSDRHLRHRAHALRPPHPGTWAFRLRIRPDLRRHRDLRAH